jgi:hypothetical protein
MIEMTGSNDCKSVEVKVRPNRYEYPRDRDRLVQMGAQLLEAISAQHKIDDFSIKSEEGVVSVQMSSDGRPLLTFRGVEQAVDLAYEEFFPEDIED